MLNRKRFLIGMLLFILAAALYGCSSSNNASNPESTPQREEAPTPAADTDSGNQSPEKTVTDDLGNTIHIPADPQRILAPYLEDALLSLGIKPVAQWSAGALLLKYLQPELKDVPKLDFVKLDPEAIAGFEPDLFIIPFAARVQNGAYEQYAKAAPTYVFQDATSDWRKTLLTLGELLNRTDKANEALKEYDAKMASFKEHLQGSISGKKAAIMLISEKSFSLMQVDTYSGKVLYGELGFQSSPLAVGNDWKELSLESLPELDADYIFLMQVDGADPLKNSELGSIFGTSIWKNLKAVKEGHLYSVDRDYWINTGLKANVKVAENVEELLAP